VGHIPPAPTSQQLLCLLTNGPLHRCRIVQVVAISRAITGNLAATVVVGYRP
jgi:hypothetical protein